jgi:hypothetical protein
VLSLPLGTSPLPHTLGGHNPIDQLIIRRHRHLAQRARLGPQSLLLGLRVVRAFFRAREGEDLFRQC